MLCGKKVGLNPVSSGILNDIVVLTKDPVPNVRFKAVKILMDICDTLPKGAKSEIVVPALRRMKTDRDEDVVFYAQEALGVYTSA